MKKKRHFPHFWKKQFLSTFKAAFLKTVHKVSLDFEDSYLVSVGSIRTSSKIE